MHSIKYPFYFHLFLEFPISRDSIARRFLIPQHFMSMLIQTKFCLSGIDQLNFPALSPSQPHLRIFGCWTNLYSCYCALGVSEVERVFSFD